jgi:mono/diheme cytochrome c family protein
MMLDRTHRRAPLAAVSLAAALCAAGALAASPSNTSTDTGKVTWAEHVAPILYQGCVTCHRPGQTAPMSLLTWSEARPWARSIRQVTQNGTMPPWFANPAHGKFVEDPRLTEEQIDLIARWVAAGAPAGDLEQAPEPPTFTSEWLIGEPDVVFTMEPFEVADDVEDHYQWLKVENHLTEDRWIKAIEVHPTFVEAVHHQLTYLGPPDATVQSVQGAGTLDLDFVSGWGPGVAPLAYPEGYGMLLSAGATVFFQMHYHKTPGPGTGGIDQSSVGMTFYDQKPENRITTLWIVDPALDIPAGEASYPSSSSFTAEHDAVIFDFTPHMHLRGRAMRFTAEYPSGEPEVLLDVVDYDFNWQLTYTPTEPKRIPAGTRIVVDAVFDNSADNPLNPDPTVPVRFGEKTTDEMMVGFLHYSFVDKELQDDMPTFSVPENMREQFEQIQRFRQQQREAKAAAEATGSGD